MMKKRDFQGIKKHNGQKLLINRNDSFLTNIQILTSVGSIAEDDSIQGMAHILEHMFFKGSKKRPGGTSISRAANDIGGKMNAYTTYDHTVYYITVLNDKFEEGFDILADMYQNPLFPEEEFAKELNPILSEFREKEDDPDSFLMDKALETFLGKNYHPVIGTKESITSANVNKMHDFKNRFYGGENTLIAIAGGVDDEKILKSVEKYFTNPGEKEIPKKIAFDYNPGEMVLYKKGIQEAYYTLFFPALNYQDPDRYKQDMMNYMLGGNDSALLFERIREELGMSCYGIYSWTMRYNGFSTLAISCGIAPDELNKLHEEVQKQIERICNEKLEKDRLERGRASLRTSIAAKSETSSGLNSMISVSVLRGETEDPVQKSLNAIESITLDEILEQAQKTFSAPAFKAILLPEN